MASSGPAGRCRCRCRTAPQPPPRSSSAQCGQGAMIGDAPDPVGTIMTMHVRMLTILLVAATAAIAAQEREPPKDSERLRITGCVDNRTLIAASTAERETAGEGVQDGRRFRLSGPGKLLDEIKAR